MESSDILIRNIRPEDYANAFAFQCEYLDNETFPDFLQRVRQKGGIYLAAFCGEELVGICYGHPGRKPREMTLQGIAVCLDDTKNYARKGIGSRLLRCFEAEAKSGGATKVSVGSAADPKVERFYLKNGYEPVELAAFGPGHQELARVTVNGYEQGNLQREQLRLAHRPREVIFIFEKKID
jgi:GNAT superfamily N-acetyltransferase